MIQLNVNGNYVNLIEENNLRWQIEPYFDELFNGYLLRNFGIDNEQFKKIIKELAAEHFV